MVVSHCGHVTGSLRQRCCTCRDSTSPRFTSQHQGRTSVLYLVPHTKPKRPRAALLLAPREPSQPSGNYHFAHHHAIYALPIPPAHQRSQGILALYLAGSELSKARTVHQRRGWELKRGPFFCRSVGLPSRGTRPAAPFLGRQPGSDETSPSSPPAASSRLTFSRPPPAAT